MSGRVVGVVRTYGPREEDDVFEFKAETSDSVTYHHVNRMELLIREWETLRKEGERQGGRERGREGGREGERERERERERE